MKKPSPKPPTKKAPAKKAPRKKPDPMETLDGKGEETVNVTPLKSSPGYLVETWPLHEVRPYERNARKIPEAAIEKVAKSLQEFGWRQPMVVDPDGVLIVGHTRRLAAVHLGWTEGPVHVAKDLTSAQIRAYRLMDNRSHQETDWDPAMLPLELEGLLGLDFDLALTGFNDAELARFLNGEGATDPMGEWQGMPEFEQNDDGAYRSIKVHFASQSAVDDFVRLVGQPINEGTKYIWHPMRGPDDLKAHVYISDESSVSPVHSFQE